MVRPSVTIYDRPHDATDRPSGDATEHLVRDKYFGSIRLPVYIQNITKPYLLVAEEDDRR